jgi:hypothetical protein
MFSKTVQINSQYALVALKSSLNSNSDWCVDSGASLHLCCKKSMFNEIDYDAPILYISGVSSKSIASVGTGTCRIPVKDRISGNIVNIVLDNVYYVPDQPHNIISVKRILDKYSKADTPDFRTLLWRIHPYVFKLEWIYNMYRLVPISKYDSDQYEHLHNDKVLSVSIDDYHCNSLSLTNKIRNQYSMLYSLKGRFDINIFDPNKTLHDQLKSKWNNRSFYGVTPPNISITTKNLEGSL